MRFASSSQPSKPKRVAKILFKDSSGSDGASTEFNPKFGDLQLPVATFREVADRLGQSNKLLPASARVLQDWRVGFLERFSLITRSEAFSDVSGTIV